MIFIREKVELFGISWLNYSKLSFIIGVALLSYAYYRSRKSQTNKCHRFSKAVAGVFAPIMILMPLAFWYNHGSEHNLKETPLSAIDDKITVNDDKVVINGLDKNFVYRDENKDPSKRQIFKFEYGEFYETGKLVDENGKEYKLSEEDTNYLRSKQAKGEK